MSGKTYNIIKTTPKNFGVSYCKDDTLNMIKYTDIHMESPNVISCRFKHHCYIIILYFKILDKLIEKFGKKC